MNTQSNKHLSIDIRTILVLGVLIMGGGLIGSLVYANKYFDNKVAEQLGTSIKNPSIQNAKEAGVIVDDFLGDKGKSLVDEDGVISISEDNVSDGDMHNYHYFSESINKTIYFFILQAPDGTYRAAANACEVCYGSKKGFTQIGDMIRCENCQTTYRKDQIAMEKGGCNPSPISKDVLVKNGQLMLDVDDVESVAYLF
ncbi:Fe-S-containing protein [Patescibacteria group bacterium]